MGSDPLHIASAHRQLLADFERRYAGWSAARAAAETAALALALRVQEHGPAEDLALQRMLDLHAAASRLQQEAMQPLRDTPI
ncbi:MAG TPA: hypothetical protein VEB23_11825 [Ramlibacter sp.]|nr:hypothetical protein [Ramlibacter sp.]